MNICVVGTGYVGLVTGAVFADLGNDVVCVDNDRAKIESLRAGRMPIYEPGLEEMVVRNTQDAPAVLHHGPRRRRPPVRRDLHRRRHALEGQRGNRPVPGRGGGDRDRPRDGPLQGGGQQVHLAGGHGRLRPRGDQPAPADAHRVRRGLQPRVPPRGLRHRGHSPARPHRHRRPDPASRHDARGAVRAARAPHDHHRPAVGGGDQVRLQRLPRRQDLLHQRHRRISARRRGRT